MFESLRPKASEDGEDQNSVLQSIFKVKVDSVRTANFAGKERRRGKFTGYRPDWKKAYT